MQQVLIAACGVLMFGCASWGGQNASPTIAEGDGLHVTLHELDERVKQSLFDERTRGQANRVYELRAKALDEMLGDLVMEAEAERRGLSRDALIEAEAAAVTDEDVTAFFEGNRQRMPADTAFEDVEAALRKNLEDRSRKKVVTSLVADANVVIHLAPPRIEVAADGPSLGPETAPITIIEFSDFQCPYCRRALPIIKEVMSRHPEDVRVVYRHLPLEAIHPRARPAAEAAACAEDQGHFWEFHDRLFEGKGALSASGLRAHAEAIGLDLDAYDGCVSDRTHRDDVTADLEAARAAGISSTPAFLVNGVLLTGAQPVAAFERLIERELQALAATP
jgi:protein-disulfide isomerase